MKTPRSDSSSRMKMVQARKLEKENNHTPSQLDIVVLDNGHPRLKEVYSTISTKYRIVSRLPLKMGPNVVLLVAYQQAPIVLSQLSRSYPGSQPNLVLCAAELYPCLSVQHPLVKLVCSTSRQVDQYLSSKLALNQSSQLRLIPSEKILNKARGTFPNGMKFMQWQTKALHADVFSTFPQDQPDKFHIWAVKTPDRSQSQQQLLRCLNRIRAPGLFSSGNRRYGQQDMRLHQQTQQEIILDHNFVVRKAPVYATDLKESVVRHPTGGNSQTFEPGYTGAQHLDEGGVSQLCLMSYNQQNQSQQPIKANRSCAKLIQNIGVGSRVEGHGTIQPKIPIAARSMQQQAYQNFNKLQHQGLSSGQTQSQSIFQREMGSPIQFYKQSEKVSQNLGLLQGRCDYEQFSSITNEISQVADSNTSYFGGRDRTSLAQQTNQRPQLVVKKSLDLVDLQQLALAYDYSQFYTNAELKSVVSRLSQQVFTILIVDQIPESMDYFLGHSHFDCVVIPRGKLFTLQKLKYPHFKWILQGNPAKVNSLLKLHLQGLRDRVLTTCTQTPGVVYFHEQTQLALGLKKAFGDQLVHLKYSTPSSLMGLINNSPLIVLLNPEFEQMSDQIRSQNPSAQIITYSNGGKMHNRVGFGTGVARTVEQIVIWIQKIL